MPINIATTLFFIFIPIAFVLYLSIIAISTAVKENNRLKRINNVKKPEIELTCADLTLKKRYEGYLDKMFKLYTRSIEVGYKMILREECPTNKYELMFFLYIRNWKLINVVISPIKNSEVQYWSNPSIKDPIIFEWHGENNKNITRFTYTDSEVIYKILMYIFILTGENVYKKYIDKQIRDFKKPKSYDYHTLADKYYDCYYDYADLIDTINKEAEYPCQHNNVNDKDIEYIMLNKLNNFYIDKSKNLTSNAEIAEDLIALLISHNWIIIKYIETKDNNIRTKHYIMRKKDYLDMEFFIFDNDSEIRKMTNIYKAAILSGYNALLSM